MARGGSREPDNLRARRRTAEKTPVGLAGFEPATPATQRRCAIQAALQPVDDKSVAAAGSPHLTWADLVSHLWARQLWAGARRPGAPGSAPCARPSRAASPTGSPATRCSPPPPMGRPPL